MKLIEINKISKGFSILEIMVALAIISILGTGLYQLELSELSAATQANTRQLIMATANNLTNQIIAHLNYCNSIHPERRAGCTPLNKFPYVELSYSEHTINSGIIDCSKKLCSDSQIADYILYKWKAGLADIKEQAANVLAIVCRDSSLIPPTLINPSCNGFGNLVIKIVWYAHIAKAESGILGKNNYIILTVPYR